MLVESCSKEIVQILSYDTRLKLSPIYCHFDALGLREFLRNPVNETIWETVYARYQAHGHRCVSYDDFVKSFDFLLPLQRS